MTSLPCVIGRIARCWIADGFSKSLTLCELRCTILKILTARTVRVDAA
jgi:hypothetical protein